MTSEAILGGSFDPPHVGHVLLAATALSLGAFDRVLVVPAFAHAFGKSSLPFEHRLAMSRLAFEPLGSRVVVSDVESRLGAHPVYTVDVLERLTAEGPTRRRALVMGSDLLAGLERWHRIDRLRELADFFVVARGAAELAGCQAPPIVTISSSELRARLGRGEDTATWLAPAVRAYIAAHGLYARSE